MRSLAVFASAALLFWVELLVAQRLLPTLGGAPSVWLGASLAFQALLLGATALANRLARAPAATARGALSLLGIASLAWMGGELEQGGLLHVPSALPGPPLAQVIAAVLRMAGPPFLLLGVAGPLLQRGGEGAFRRYALSSGGSIVGLAIGPLVVARLLDLDAQATLWTALFVGLALLIPLCLLADETPAPARSEGPTRYARVVALAALGAALQLAITRHVTEDVAPVPLLWVIPLALYLGTYVVAFAAPRWATPERAGPILIAGLVGSIEVLGGGYVPLALQAAAFGLLLWGGCLLCHGLLQQLRPPGAELPRFSLAIQLGGLLGSAAVSLVAPLLFRGETELPLCLALLLGVLVSSLRGRLLPALLAAAAGIDLALRVRTALGHLSLSSNEAALLATAAGIAIAVALIAIPRGARVAAVALVAALSWDHVQDLRGALAQRRNFFGIVRVERLEGYEPPQDRRLLVSGAIVHGFEWIDPAREREPTAYYRPQTGLGQLLSARPAGGGGRSVGVLGLGAGTVATYAQPGDRFRFYELNPDMVWAARAQFHFLSRAQGAIELVEGDGRLALAREPPQSFDVLVLDAFSGDAIPVHLLTTEAFTVYLRQLAPQGVIAVNVTNNHVDLEPVVARLAQHFGLEGRRVDTPAEGLIGFSAHWILLARPGQLDALLPTAAPLVADGRPPWTDGRVDLLEVLR